MTRHRYACGQHVRFTDGHSARLSRGARFKIIKLLPSGDEAPRYEIRSLTEPYSRAAYEDQLSASADFQK